jgi:hypothetical protein
MSRSEVVNRIAGDTFPVLAVGGRLAGFPATGLLLGTEVVNALV